MEIMDDNSIRPGIERSHGCHRIHYTGHNQSDEPSSAATEDDPIENPALAVSARRTDGRREIDYGRAIPTLLRPATSGPRHDDPPTGLNTDFRVIGRPR